MGNTIDEIIRHSSPDYQMAYTDGFEACQRVVAERLKILTKEIEELTAYVTSTSTPITNEDNLK